MNSDPATIFADLHDRLFPRSRLAIARALEAAQDAALRRDSRAMVERGADLTGMVGNDLQPAQIAAILLGIDDAFGAVSPWAAPLTGAVSPAMEALRTRYFGTGSFNDPKMCTGGVLPKTYAPGRAQPTLGATQSFHNVIRVPEHIWRSVEVVPLFSNLPAVGADRVIRVACAAFLTGRDDLDRIVRKDGGVFWYAVEPQASRVADRVLGTLAQLDGSGAHLGIVPESTLNNEVLSAWTDALRATKCPEGSSLRWVLVGTGPVDEVHADGQPFNRAVILDRLSGDRVVHQDKRTGYTMVYAELNQRGFTGHEEMRRTDVAHEWMSEGDKLRVLETPVGRLAVLVCEDLARIDRHLEQVMSLGITHVLVPVLSASLLGGPDRKKRNWEARAAFELTRWAGCHVVIANSCAFANPEDGDPLLSLSYSPGRTPEGDWQRRPHMQTPEEDDASLSVYALT